MLIAGPAAAQASFGGDGDSVDVTHGVSDSIDAAEILRHIRVIAHDSMKGRQTPSRELELTAQYIADQFRALGLRPGGPNSSWLQRYPIPGTDQIDYATATAIIVTDFQRKGQASAHDDTTQGPYKWRLDSFPLQSIAYPAMSVGEYHVPSFFAAPLAVLLAGTHTLESVRNAQIDRFTSVIYVPAADVDSTVRRRIIEELHQSRVGRGVLVVSDRDSLAFAERHRQALRKPFRMVRGAARTRDETHGFAVHVWAGAMDSAFAALGLNVDQLRMSREPVLLDLPLMFIGLQGKIDTTLATLATAPNVIGILPGTDSARTDYIVISAHMDARSVDSSQRGDIYTGADDNASGVAGLLALAKALVQSGAPLSRPIAFVGLSGSGPNRGFWGVNEFVGAFGWNRHASMIANITLDMIGRSSDSVIVDGLTDVAWPVRPDWLVADGSEWGIRIVDGGTSAMPSSDHFAFVGKAIPSLHFHGGSHDDAPAMLDPISVIDADAEARVLRVVFHVVRGLANAPRPVMWTPTGRQARSLFFGR